MTSLNLQHANDHELFSISPSLRITKDHSLCTFRTFKSVQVDYFSSYRIFLSKSTQWFSGKEAFNGDTSDPGWDQTWPAPEGKSYLPLHVRDKTVCFCLTDRAPCQLTTVSAGHLPKQKLFLCLMRFKNRYLYLYIWTKPDYTWPFIICYQSK